MNTFEYIVAKNPEQVFNFLQSKGIVIKSKKDILPKTIDYVKNGGDDRIVDILQFHPEKDALLLAFANTSNYLDDDNSAENLTRHSNSELVINKKAIEKAIDTVKKDVDKLELKKQLVQVEKELANRFEINTKKIAEKSGLKNFTLTLPFEKVFLAFVAILLLIILIKK